ncbi:MAG: DUF1080 domain-containing protein [Fuerstiella sp.]|nr:DUF1080 domain-containing protein [Fuerstiella sp.]
MRGYTFVVLIPELLLVGALVLIAPACCGQDEGRDIVIVPHKEVIHPFNSTDLSGFTTWLQLTGAKDPASDYRVTDGMIHVGGRGMGYLATVDSYRDYHLSVEYKWGERTDGSGNVRNSGILLHATGPPGNARGIWMASIECQLAQGCEGDIICIRGNDKDGNTIPVSFISDTRMANDGRTRWHRNGLKTAYAGKQFWWSNHEVGFQERLDTRGADDVASPLGEWTKVECICDGARITIKINGTIVNECYDVYPTAGRILLENEKNEVLFRNLELRPLKPLRLRGRAEDSDRHSAGQ